MGRTMRQRPRNNDIQALRTEQLSQTSDGMDRMGGTRRPRARANASLAYTVRLSSLRRRTGNTDDQAVNVCTAGYEHGFTAYRRAPALSRSPLLVRCSSWMGACRVSSADPLDCRVERCCAGRWRWAAKAMAGQRRGRARASSAPPRRRTAQRPRLSNIAAHSGDKLDDLLNEGGRALEIPRRSRPSDPAGHVKGNVRGHGEREKEQEWKGANSLGKFAG
jgi:hypothetical protein